MCGVPESPETLWVLCQSWASGQLGAHSCSEPDSRPCGLGRHARPPWRSACGGAQSGWDWSCLCSLRAADGIQMSRAAHPRPCSPEGSTFPAQLPAAQPQLPESWGRRTRHLGCPLPGGGQPGRVAGGGHTRPGTSGPFPHSLQGSVGANGGADGHKDDHEPAGSWAHRGCPGDPQLSRVISKGPVHGLLGCHKAPLLSVMGALWVLQAGAQSHTA